MKKNIYLILFVQLFISCASLEIDITKLESCYAELTYEYKHFPRNAQLEFLVTDTRGNYYEYRFDLETAVNGRDTITLYGLCPDEPITVSPVLYNKDIKYYGKHPKYLRHKVFKTKAYSFELVDLGLSVNWASHNVGAELPYDAGEFLTWGYPHGLSSLKRGLTRKGRNLNSSEDAASILWGDGWRTPTVSEMRELLEECTWQYIRTRNLALFAVIGPNGNVIHMPMNGVYTWNQYKGVTPNGYLEVIGAFWTSTSTKDEYGQDCAHILRMTSSPVFSDDRVWMTKSDFDIRYNVRAVKDK